MLNSGCDFMCKKISAETIGHNTKAVRNGKTFENFAIKHLRGVEYIGGVYDAVYRGLPLEIKSCEAMITDSHASKNRRSGRFVFNSEQHEELKARGGTYYVIVHQGKKVLRRKLIKVDALPLPEFQGVKAVSWKTVFEMVGAA